MSPTGRVWTALRSRRGRAGAGEGGSPPPQALLEFARLGPAPLLSRPGAAPEMLNVAAIVPSFRRGSGGHRTIVRLLEELAHSGHTVSAWLEDGEGRHAHESPAVTQRSFAQFFDAEKVQLHVGLERWQGADIVMATGWQTVARALLLPRCRARAYLVQDHEPDFYGASAEATWARDSYRRGLHCIAASPWLAELLRNRYDASASHLDLAVDHSVYRPAGQRRNDLVAFYARAVTPRRAVPLGLLALSELATRKPDLEIVLFGEDRGLPVQFRHSHAGILSPRRLSELYSQATVGMVLSLTNPSLIGLEMMACGLPCVELASEPMLKSFERDGPLQLAQPDPLALCGAIESLLEDVERRETLSRAGIALMAERTWARAAAQLEQGLRVAIAAPTPAPDYPD